MSDLLSPYVSLLFIGNLLDAEVSLIEALKKIPLLRAFCNSEWMQRMWVTLEYSQSNAASPRVSWISRAVSGGPVKRLVLSLETRLRNLLAVDRRSY
jgi:hypothetical protein